MKKNITIEHNLSLWDLDGLTIDEMIDYLRDFRNQLVDKGLLESPYDFHSYGDCDLDSKFYIIRQETDEEYNSRIREEDRKIEDYKKHIEAKEQSEYLRLKQKYEGK